MNNDDLNENNINKRALEERNQIQNNNEKSQAEQNENVNEKFLMSTMKLEMARQKDNLSKCESTINKLNKENNELKVLQLELSKELSTKEDIINSNKVEINRLQAKNSNLEREYESKQKIIQELNYKIIELTQKIESNDNLNKISQK